MFNVFEKPWPLFGAAIAGLIIIYIIQLDRKMYWLSLAILLCCVLLHLSSETGLLDFSRTVTMLLKVILPTATAGFIILLSINIAQLNERSAYLWLVPVFLCVFAFGLDRLVRTDREKITAVIDEGIKAVEQEDCEGIAKILSEDYQDSFHKDKEDLIRHCKRVLYEPVIKNNRKTHQQVDITAENATATIVFWTSFEPDGGVFEMGKTLMQTGAMLHLKKTAGKKWLINKAEILEIDRQKVGWSTIKNI